MTYTIEQTPQFVRWIAQVSDRTSRLRLLRRLEKAQNGHLGDVKPVGGGVFEMREHFGAGYRMYYVQRGQRIIIMLGGGDKSSQQRDIARAIETAKEI